MDKIVEFINKKTNNKYQDLLFFEAVYNKKTSAMQIIFKKPKNLRFPKENVAEIEVLCKEFLAGLVDNICVEIKTDGLSMQEFKDYVKHKITSNINFSSIDANLIKFEFDGDVTKVAVPYNSNMIENSVLSFEKQNIEQEILDDINVKVTIDFEDDNTSSNDILKIRKEKITEDNKILEKLKESQIVELKNVENIVGELSGSKAFIAGCLGIPSGSAIVVGNVKSLLERETKPKTSSEDDEKNNEQKNEAKSEPKKYYIIELEYDNLVTRCVWFNPKIKDIEHIIVNGMTLAVEGFVDEYKGTKSLRVKNIAKCNFEPPKEVWRSVPSTYRCVKPEKYEFFEQVNFFTEQVETKKEYLKNNVFVCYDLETTGINHEVCKIIDIGAFKIVNGKITERFSSFVNPMCPIPEEASRVNHITDQMVENMPSIDDVLPDFYRFCDGAIILGYNNIGFDDLFIKKEGKRLRYNFDNKRDDVMIWAKQNIKGAKNYKLGTMCETMGVQLIDAHRATNDALATAKLFIKLVEKFG
jgi:DNA polymerase III epsilon subunit family exonuclease